MTPIAFEIRTVLETDEAGVLALWRESFPGDYAADDLVREFRQKLRHPDDLFLVAVSGGLAVATALGGYDGHRGHIHAVAVAPPFRRHGIGRRMFEELFARLRCRGCRKLNLLVRPDNAAAVAFYESLGFRLDVDVCMSRPLDA
jgi:ribosomal protein S18 acetylase RimI-like enzyme